MGSAQRDISAQADMERTVGGLVLNVTPAGALGVGI